MSRLLRSLSCALVLLLALFASLLGLTKMNDSLGDCIAIYPQTSRLFSLRGVTEDKADQIYALLKKTVAQHNAFVVRNDMRLAASDAGVDGFELGIFGNPRGKDDLLTLSYLGTPILTSHAFTQLLHSESNKTLGLDMAKADMLADLPTISIEGSRLVVRQLDALVDNSKTKLGDYRIVGLSNRDYHALVTQAARIAGTTYQDFQRGKSGIARSNSFNQLTFIIVCIVTVLLLGITIIADGYLSYRTLGSYLLLGWSRSSFALRHLMPILVSELAVYPLVCIVMSLFTHGFIWNIQLLMQALIIALPVIAVVLLLSALVILMIISVKPVDAIRNRITKRGMLIALALVYAIASTCVLEGVHSIDGPIGELTKSVEVARMWHPVLNQRIMYHHLVGQDGASVSGQSTQYAKDAFAWYRSIEDKPGVRLIYTSFFDADILQDWRNGSVYKHVPSKPFWSFVASPKYLQDQGFTVDNEVKNLARQGVRIYFIPDTYNPQEQTSMKQWLQESDNLTSTDVSTKFTAHPQFAFRTYHPSREWFNWSTDIHHKVMVKDPIIFYATSDNLNASESESLLAGGLDNSYIKLNDQAAARYLSDAYTARYHLDDNHLQFLQVGECIAGYQKTIMQTLQLFGSVILLITLLMLILLIAIIAMFAACYQESIAVKRLLGFSLLRIFSMPFLLVGLVQGVLFIIASIERTRSGMIYVLISAIIELILLTIQTYYLSNKHITSMVKE